MSSPRDLAKDADAILRKAHCDTISGAKKDKNYRRDKRAKEKRLSRARRAKSKKLGKFGAASAVRTIAPDDGT